MKTLNTFTVSILAACLLAGCGDDPASENQPVNNEQMFCSEAGITEDIERSNETASEPDQNIAEILETDPRFSDVLELVNIIGLLDAMRGPGPFTVFVPINTVVQAMPDRLLQEIRNDQNYLHEFILTHVAEGDYPTQVLCGTSEVEMIGRVVDISPPGDGNLLIGNSRILEADIIATNGRLHALETVISLPGNESE